MALFALNRGYAVLKEMTGAYQNIICRYLLARTHLLAGRTGRGEFGPGWLGVVSRAGKYLLGPAAEFNTSYIYSLLFLERRVSTSQFYLIYIL